MTHAAARNVRRRISQEPRVQRPEPQHAPETAVIEPAVLKTAEAAVYCNLSPRTVQTLTQSGKLQKVRLSKGRIGYLRKDLDAYLEASRVAMTNHEQ